jgi:DNA-binding transcriptional LysR family regulator
MSSDPRLLRAFVVLAQELHFGRAAAALNVTQPALSQQIKRLEDQLGVALFARTRSSVELTDAGRAALSAARRAVDAAAAVDAIAAGFARGERGELRVGLSPGTHYISQAALARFQRARPHVRIHATQDSSGALARRIAAGRLDVGIGFCTARVAGIVCEHLADEPAVLAVPVDHRLAAAGSVSLAGLAGERFALVDAEDGAGYNRGVVERCRAAGFEPRVSARPRGPMAWETAVRTEGCVGLTTRSAAPSTARDVRLVRLEPPVTFPIELIRPADGDGRWGPVAVAFAEAARAATAGRALPG